VRLVVILNAQGTRCRFAHAKFNDDNNVPFATLIEPSNPKSGPYGGMSVGIFPVDGAHVLFALGTGTTDYILTRLFSLGQVMHGRHKRSVKLSINVKNGLRLG